MIIKIIITIFLCYFSYIDCKRKTIASVPLILLCCVGVLRLGIDKVSIPDCLSGALLGGILVGISFITRQRLGLGDSLLLTIIGLTLGFQYTIFIIFYALLGSAIFSMFLIAIKHVNRQYKIPFIPFVLLGYIGTIFL